uniref:Sad1 and UNC84 domain containing 1 n=1 Tax=Ornithorhynchus anatinus TaxID=9258 RepID=A0A6I8NQU2_ORNAN
MDFSRLHMYTPPQCVPENTGYTYALSSSYSSEALNFETEHKLDPVFDSPRMSRRSLRLVTTANISNSGQTENVHNSAENTTSLQDRTSKTVKQRRGVSKQTVINNIPRKAASNSSSFLSQNNFTSNAIDVSLKSSVLDESLIREQTKVDHLWGLDDDTHFKGGSKTTVQENGDLAVRETTMINGYICNDCSMLSERKDALTTYSASHGPSSRIYSRDRSQKSYFLMQTLQRIGVAGWYVSKKVLSFLWLAIVSPGKAASGTFWWLGIGWYQFVALVSWLNVFLLTRCLRKVCKLFLLLIPLLLLLGLGLSLWDQGGFHSFLPVFNWKNMYRPQMVNDESRPFFKPQTDSSHLNQPSEGDTKLFDWHRMGEIERKMTFLSERCHNYDEEYGKVTLLLQKLQTRVDQMDDKSGSLTLIKNIVEEHLNEMKSAGTSDSKVKLRKGCSVLHVDSQVRETIKLMFSGDQQDGSLDWLLQWLSSKFVSKGDLQVLLQDLELQILKNISLHMSLTKETPTSETVITAVRSVGISGITEAQAHTIVNNALKLYSQDKTGMVDFALESGGGSILSTRCSETYETKTALISLFGIPLWYFSQSPRVVIQPDIHPGNCWAFKGSQGYLVVRLSMMIYPTAFTLEHIPKTLSPTGNITSAPKVFSVYGLENEYQEEGLLLGQFTYDQAGESLQMFQAAKKPEKAFQIVELRISSNWGHPEYTCLYRFRVHGEPIK